METAEGSEPPDDWVIDCRDQGELRDLLEELIALLQGAPPLKRAGGVPPPR